MIDTEKIYHQSSRYYVKRVYHKNINDKTISLFTLKNSDLLDLADHLNNKLDLDDKPKKAEVEDVLTSYFNPFRGILWRFNRR